MDARTTAIAAIEEYCGAKWANGFPVALERAIQRLVEWQIATGITVTAQMLHWQSPQWPPPDAVALIQPYVVFRP